LDRSTIGVELRRPAFDHQWTEYGSTDPSDVQARLKSATIAISNKVPIREADLEQLPGLRLVALAATGYDVIDVECCRRKKIAVVNIRDYAVDTVPEHTFALILALRRNLLSYVSDVRGGRWQTEKRFCVLDYAIKDLRGATIGIVGEGSIGQATAHLAEAFGMNVLFADHAPPKAEGLRYTQLSELIACSDVISLHLPLTPHTRNMIGRSELRSMKASAVLINTARGGLVDESALAEALTAGWIAGAGVDVLTCEPPVEGNPLLAIDAPNLIVTPHIAWASEGAMKRLAEQLIGNIEAFVVGRPRNVVA